MRTDGIHIRPFVRKPSGLTDTVRREWRWLVIGVLGGLTAAFVYTELADAQYPVRETLALQRGTIAPQMAELHLNAPDFGKRLLDTAFASNTLRTRLRDLPGSHFAVAGTGEDALQAVQRQMTVAVDPVTDSVTVGLTSPFPHQAAEVVHCVADTLLAKPTDGQTTLDPTLLNNRDAASADVDAVGLPMALLFAAAAGAGLLVGVAMAMYRQKFHRRIRLPGQIEQEVGVASAGYLPRVSHKMSHAGRGLAAYSDPASDIALQCRTSLLQLFKGNEAYDSRVMLITSPGTREGRSTVAMNLATTLALMDESVLLVDANLMAPVVHKMLGEPEADLGFCQALDNPTAALDFVRQTHVDNLHFLSCGKLSSAAAAKLQGRSLGAVLSVLQERFKHIIFDGGALLGNPDMLALAGKCDATLLVCNARRTSTRRAREAARKLKEFGVTDLHALVTDVPGRLGDKHFSNQRPLYKTAPAATPSNRHGEIYEYGLTAS